jgi:hypothetical protein
VVWEPRTGATGREAPDPQPGAQRAYWAILAAMAEEEKAPPDLRQRGRR